MGGITKFADYTTEEFAMMNGFLPNLSQTTLSSVNVGYSCTACKHFRSFIRAAYKNDIIDWREAGAVTPVKDQGFCGSCWAFSTTGDLEGAQYLDDLKLIERSEEQLVQCNTNCGGCGGGNVAPAFKYFMGCDGSDTEENYPYTDYTSKGYTYPWNHHSSPRCRRYSREQNSPRLLSVTGFFIISASGGKGGARLSEEDMKLALFKVGPFSCALNDDSMHGYVGGIEDPSEKECSRVPKHSVLCVGLGKNDAGVAYWIIKNSWGTDWGLSGYFQIVFGKNACGMGYWALHSIVESNSAQDQ